MAAMKIGGFLALAGLLAAGRAGALELEARADRTEVDLDGRVAITLTLRGGQGEPEIDLGATEGFQVYSSGTSQSISIVNGQISSSITYTYLLSPRAEGEFAIGPFEATLGGSRATAPPIRRRVTKGATPAPGRSPEPTPRTPSDRGRQRDVFLTAALDKKEAFVGEAVTLTFRLYTRVRFATDPEYDPPSTEGFWKEDLPPQQRFFDDYNGVRYSVTEIKTALFPTKPGRLVVGPARLSYVEDTFFSVDPFDLLRGGGAGRRRAVQETVRSDSIVLRVSPLPERGRPPDFTGAVGSFTFESSIDKTTVGANEPITLTLTLEGEGNIQGATLPDIRVPDSFKEYDSGSSTDISKDGYRVRGKKTYTHVMVPRYGGDYEIAPVSFTWFDPKRAEYVTRSTEPFRIRVEGPPPEEKTEQREIARKDEDIRYLKDPGSVHWGAARKPPPFSLLIGLNALPLVALGALLVLRKRREKYERDPVWARAQRADRVARAVLADAGRRMGDQDSREFASALARAVLGFLTDKGNIPTTGMTRREIARELERRGAEGDLRDRLTRLLDSCDRARFAAEPLSAEERRLLLQEGEEIVRLSGRLFEGS
jgi:hypothetical protein